MNYYNLFKLYEAISTTSINDVDLIEEISREAFVDQIEKLEKILEGVFLRDSNKSEES